MMELIGFKGVSAWLVYNKVVFNLPFIRENRAASRRFSHELAEAAALEDVEAMRAFILSLTTDSIPRAMSHAECLEAFKAKAPSHRRAALLECLTYADLSDDEVMRLLAVHSDANGIPYTRASLGNLKVADVTPMMLDTLVAASAVDVDLSLVTAAEVDMLGGKRLDVKAETADILAQTPTIGVGEALALAIKKCFGGVTNVRRS